MHEAGGVRLCGRRWGCNGAVGGAQVAWKNHLHMLHPSPQAYAAFMGNVAMWTGIVTGSLMVCSPLIFERLGWRGVAGVTPHFMLLTGARRPRHRMHRLLFLRSTNRGTSRKVDLGLLCSGRRPRPGRDPSPLLPNCSTRVTGSYGCTL